MCALYHPPAPTHIPFQAVTKEALTEDRRVAYWYTRYTLRPVASAAAAASGATSREASPSPTKHIGAGGGRAQVAVDVPVFLRDHVNTILATGGCGRVVGRHGGWAEVTSGLGCGARRVLGGATSAWGGRSFWCCEDLP